MVVIVEDETLLDKVDLEKDEVWLLNKTKFCEVDSRVHESLVTETFQPNTEKFPRLFTEVCKYHSVNGVLQFPEYRVITHDKKSFKKKVEYFVCDEDWIEEI